MARVLAWTGIALAVSYLVFVGGAGVGLITADLRLITLSVAAVGLGVWLLRAWRAPEWRPRSALLPAILACIASLAIATATSRDPRVSLEYLAFAIVLAGLYLLLVRLLADTFFRPRVIALGAGLYAVVAATYVVVVVARWVAWWGVLGRFAIPPLRPEFESLTFGNPSNALMIAALLAVPALASARWSTRRGAAWGVTIVTLLAVVALMSGSRAGWIALAAAGTVGVIWIALGERRRWSARGIRDHLGTARARLLLGAAGVATIAIVAAIGPAIVRRLTEGGEQLRLSYLSVAWRMFVEAPVTGTGPGTWVVQRIRYTDPSETDYYIPHAHNIYIQALAEQGLVGAAAGLVVLVSLALLLRSGLRDQDPARRRWGLLALVGLAYFSAHEAFDLQVNLPAVLFALAIPVAYLDATAQGPATAITEGPRRRNLSGSGLVGAGAAVAVAVALAGLLAQELPARTADRAVALANDGDWVNARPLALEAAAADPGIASYRFTAGLAEAHAAGHEAAAAFFRSVAEEVDLPEAWVNLAAEEHALGRDGAARDAIGSALRLGYQRAAVAMAAGELSLRMGDRATAVTAFVAAVAGAPSLAGDPWWAADPTRASMLIDVVAAVGAQVPTLRLELALVTGDHVLAESLAADDATRDFVAAWAGDEAAIARLDAACVARPIDISMVLRCARVQGHAGNTDRANEFRYLANAQVGGAYALGAELRVNPGPAVGRSLEGGPAIFWGSYTYRRSTPWDVLVPSLVHLTLE